MTASDSDEPDTAGNAPGGVREGDGPDGDVDLTSAQQTRRLRNGVIGLVLLMVLVVSILLAVPGLHDVTHRLDEMNAGTLTLAIVLEFMSCVGYVFAFWLVFRRAPLLFAARVAWTEMAFGAAVSLGGAGSVAIGAWLLTARGMPAGRVAERSAVLFLLTSAVNVIVLVVFAAGLAFGILEGPENELLSALPAGVGLAVLAFFLALPRWAERIARRRGDPAGRVSRVLFGLAESIRDTARMLTTPDWRLLGAIGYLAFDIAVLGVCLHATGHGPALAGVVLAYQIGYLLNIVPVPGGIGVLDAGLVGMLVLYGAQPAAAAAAVIIYHAISLWVPALVGTIAFLRLRPTLKRPLELREAR